MWPKQQNHTNLQSPARCDPCSFVPNEIVVEKELENTKSWNETLENRVEMMSKEERKYKNWNTC